MINLEHQKKELLEEIHRLGYESLRYSIFSDDNPREWETVIEFDFSKNVYLVYATMDRASYNRKLEFTSFIEAKRKFIEKLELDVQINRYYAENDMPVNYISPLWAKTDD